MPREIVGSNRGDFHVKVGWAPDTDVQVGVEGDDGKSLYWLLLGNSKEQLAKVGTAVREAMRSLPDDSWDPEDAGRAALDALDTLGHYEGVWTDLTRYDCNRLIRILRRARDAAFGRDE